MWAYIPGPWAAPSPCTRLRAPSTRRGPCCWPRSVAATEVAESSWCAGFLPAGFSPQVPRRAQRAPGNPSGLWRRLRAAPRIPLLAKTWSAFLSLIALNQHT